MAKLLFILIIAGALVDGLASSQSEPPLLIDAPQATSAPSTSAPLDAGN